MIIRFVDTTVKHIHGRRYDAPVPLPTSIRVEIRVLLSALTFDFPKFNLSKYECSPIDALVDGLAAERKLLRGREREQFQ
ncbi:hypothetical protein MMC32_005093 [Xylographa parallela]|nr:hypothetical protein [Xylographa parallela]